MYCTSCGKAIDDDSKFCPFCGKTVISDNPEVKDNSVPTFKAPVEEIPTFKAPSNDIPTFTAPARAHFNGPACHYHNDEPAVGRCARCGKNLCQDCCDSYGVSSGQYAGKHLCYDCNRNWWQKMLLSLLQTLIKLRVSLSCKLSVW